MVKLEKVEKYFNRHKKNEIRAIDTVSLELPDKGLVAILGNSGCRKNHIIKCDWWIR
ncbi:MAG: hypothetical protein HFJ27_03085 [Clostridia bacterium]|nr:hypothetical protein [Clostridia bacterium]